MVKHINEKEYKFIVIDDFDYNNKYFLKPETIKL